MRVSAVALCMCCVACMLHCHSLPAAADRSRRVFQGLLASTGAAVQQLRRPVLVGFGGCVDGIVDAEEFLRALNAPEHAEPRHHSEIGSEQELVEAFLFFFSKGAAGERYVRDKDLFRRMVEAAQRLPTTKWAQGGNAALMADRLRKDGLRDVTLASLKGPAGVPLVPADDIPSTDEDVHIILEYKAGSTWGGYSSPRANRLALHSDTTNAEIAVMPAVKQWLRQGQPVGMFVLGGFHLMQNYPFPVDADRGSGHPATPKLQEISQLIRDELEGVPLHLEMASLSDVGFMRAVEENLLRHATSIGSNEQELAALERYLSEGELVYATDSSPRVADTLQRMTHVMDRLSPHKLRRLHVHTLAFQAVMSVIDRHECDVDQNGDVLPESCVAAADPRIDLEGVNGSAAWLSPRASAARASLAATEWVCGDHGQDEEAAAAYSFDIAETFVMLDDSFHDGNGPDARRIHRDDDDPVTCFASRGGKFYTCVAPNLVCSKPKVTIGAGDNISGAGLMPISAA